MRSTIRHLWAAAMLAVAAVPLAARGDVSPYVRQALPGEFPPPHHLTYYPPFTTHPDTPDQGTIVINDSDPLAMVVPDFDDPSQLGLKGFSVSRSGQVLTLDAYFLYSGIVTTTIYGPTDDVYAGDPLPGGAYSLRILAFRTWDFGYGSPQDIGAFMADPVAYTTTWNLQLLTSEQDVSFTVVPEPGSLAVLGLGVFVVMSGRAGRSVTVPARRDW